MRDLPPDFHLLFESLPGAFLVVLPDAPAFTMAAASDGYLSVCGLAREKLLGRGLFEVFPDSPASDSDANGATGANGASILRASFARVIATGLPDRLAVQRYDVERPASEGGGFEERYWDARNTPVPGPDGAVRYIVHSAEEVTAKVMAERKAGAAASHLSQFRELAEACGVGLLIAGDDGRLRSVSAPLLTLLGYTGDDVKAGRVHWNRLNPPELGGRGPEVARPLAGAGKQAPFETVLVARDGRRIPVLIAASVLETGGGREVAAFVLDLTERRQNARDGFLIALEDATRALSNPEEILTATCRLLGEYLGVDRCAYGTLEPDNETVQIVAGFAGSALPPLNGPYSLSEFGAEVARLLRANSPCVVQDAATDFRLADARAMYESLGIRSMVAWPIQKGGRLVAALAVHQLAPRIWNPDEAELVRMVANRCWESIERACVTRELLSSQRRLSAIYHATDDFIGLMLPDGTLLEANRASLEFARAGRDEVVGRKFWDTPWFALTPGLPEEVRQAVGRACSGEKILLEAAVSAPSGEKPLLAIWFHPVRGREGEVEFIAAVGRDIAESRRAQEALKQAGERLEAGLNSAQVGIWTWNIRSNNVLGDPNMAFFFGIDPAAVAEGRPLEAYMERIHPDDHASVQSELGKALERGGKYATEYRVLGADGVYKWLGAQGRARLGPAGEPVSLNGIVLDITERKQAQERLQRQWHIFDTILSSTPDHHYTLDLDGRFTYANRALLALWGKPLEQVLGKSFSDLDYPPELTSRLNGYIERVIAAGLPVQDQTPFTGADGLTREYDFIFVPVLGSDGRVEALAGSSRDITERIRAEERERLRLEKFRETARLESLGVMAGGIAHDFNNLLTGILGNASLLEEVVTEADRPVAGEIVLAAERAAGLTKQMLAYSGKGRFQIELLDLNLLIEENLTLLRASLSRSVRIELALARESCWVEGDRTQLHQVIMNLLINASEAVGERSGRVTIATRLDEIGNARASTLFHALLVPGRYAVLEVRDDGVGMTTQTMRKIFDPFFTTKFTGRGLGLAAVLGIVKGHRGDIEVESEVGRGTLFRVLLPASEGTIASVPTVESAGMRAATGQTVLVTDDEELVRNMAGKALESRGFRVVVATNGAEALEILKRDAAARRPEIALAILDLTMPVMTGEEALPHIRAVRPGLPIVLSSGFGETEVARRFASANIAGVLQKPYTVAEIVSKVRGVLVASAKTPSAKAENE